MKITNLDLSVEEAETLRALALNNGHDPDSLSPANLIRAALGFDLRQRGGPRENTGPKSQTPKQNKTRKKKV